MFHAPWLLIASVVAFLVGPALHQAGRRVVAWRTALDGFALVAVGGLAALHLLPEALLHGGLVAVVLALLGAILPTLWERGASHAPNWLGLSVVLGGLAMHAAIESAALGAIVSEDHATSLGVAIASHRLPVGLMVFALVQSHKSTRAAYGAIGLLAVSTVVGFASGEAANQILGGRAGMWFQALAAGSLLHVVFAHHDPMCCDEEHAPETVHDHEHKHEHDQPDAPSTNPTFWSAIGGLFGLATVISALHAGHAGHAHGATSQHGHLTETLVLLAVECAPALLLAYLLSGLVCAATMPRRPPSLRDGSSFGQTIRGILYSLPNRITPNAVVPQYEALLGRGVPASAALAFLLAAPALGLDALLLSLPLLGLELTVARLLGAVAVAVLVAVLVGRRVEAASPAPEDGADPAAHGAGPAARSLGERLRAGMRYALIDLFDHTMPWIVAGVLVATVAQPILAHIGWTSVRPLLQVPLLALLAIPLYVGASGATPVALIAIHQGVSPGAAIAFLLAGAATNRSTFELLARLHGRSIAMLTGITVVGVAIATGWLIDGAALYNLPAWHGHHHGPVTPIVWFSLLTLGLLGLGSLFRQGPRRALHQVTTPIHTD